MLAWRSTQHDRPYADLGPAPFSGIAADARPAVLRLPLDATRLELLGDDLDDERAERCAQAPRSEDRGDRHRQRDAVLGPELGGDASQGVAHPLFGEFAFAGATRAVLRPETDDVAPTHLSDEGVGARRGPDDAELDGGTRCLGELRQVDVAQRIERLDL